MSRAALLPIRNRRTVAIADVPVVPVEALGEALAGWTGDGWRIISLFGLPEDDQLLRLIVVVSLDGESRLGVASSIVHQKYPALSSRCRQASRFEREIAEQCGAIPEGHPDLKPLRRQARADHAPAGWTAMLRDRDQYPFSKVSGDEVHEVAVGPVHAGIIEPGHFRFQAHGEEVLALEVVLGYQHRGAERLLETIALERAVYVAESLAGDSVIAHTSAFCGAIEALGRSHKSPRAQSLRGIALEIERLANHIGDLGAMSSDIAYQPAAAYFGRMRGECLNLLMTISGNRYGRGLIRPGGVAFDITPEMAEELTDRVQRLRSEVRIVADLFFNTASVQSRLEGVGIVQESDCLAYGFVGVVARSAEVRRDVRHDHPYGVFRFAQIPVASAWSGDVYARALVRWLEIQRSMDFVTEQVDALPGGAARSACGALAPSELVLALEEGWRGEVAHTVVTDDKGRVRRHKVTDPSFHNWPALALAMPGNEMSDFPLCNKSFNFSYAGHDL